ncbi:MAG: histidine phosphatase family protein, partial [Acidimicrobiales bacterium]
MLWLIRHGQTTANAAGLIQGRTDPALSDLGRRQAAALGARLPAPARVISSPLSRARRTAELAGRTVEVDDRWIELDYGRFEGEAVRDVRADLWA